MLARKLKEYRRRHNRSKRYLAKQCRLRESTILRIEARVQNPDLKQLDKLAEGMKWLPHEKDEVRYWLAEGGFFKKSDRAKVLNSESMTLIRKLEKQYGSMTNVPEDNEDLEQIRKQVGGKKLDDGKRGERNNYEIIF